MDKEFSTLIPLKVPVGTLETERKGDVSRVEMQVFHNHPYIVAYIIFCHDSCSLMVIHQVCEERQGTDEEFPSVNNCTHQSNTVREQPPSIYKKNNAKINCESAIGEHLIANPERAKTYTDENFRIIGQARSSLHLSALESVYIKTQNPVLIRQK